MYWPGSEKALILYLEDDRYDEISTFPTWMYRRKASRILHARIIVVLWAIYILLLSSKFIITFGISV